jgi:hypothetical protein
MSKPTEEVTINFSGTAILSFVLVFAILLLMSTCHGPYKVGGEKAATEKSVEK